MSRPRYSQRLPVVLAFVLLAGVLGWIIVGRRGDKDTAGPRGTSTAGPPDRARAADPEPGFARASSADLVYLLESTTVDLRRGAATAEHARQALVELFHRLDGAPPAVRRAALADFLAAGSDAPTGLAYSVGAGGFLRSWPTVRVALLDYAGRLEKDTMQALAELALVEPGSPDEWSVALRNVARASPPEGNMALFVDRTHRLLANEVWAQAPSVGYLEAFDLPVHARLFDALGRLEALMAPDRPRKVRFAAFLATDRLALLEPRDTLALLTEQPMLFSTAPTVRAGLFARADVRDAGQRAALESYLARTDLTEAERAAFVGLYPNHNTTFAHNLLTPPISLPAAEMIARDRAALEAVRGWHRDPGRSVWSGGLAEIETRLQAHLAQVP